MKYVKKGIIVKNVDPRDMWTVARDYVSPQADKNKRRERTSEVGTRHLMHMVWLCRWIGGNRWAVRDKTFDESRFGMNDSDVVEDKRWLVCVIRSGNGSIQGSLNA